jgi:hypothetical protein
MTGPYSAHVPRSTGLLLNYDYQLELDKLRLLSVVTHWVSFGGLFFLQ